MKNTPPGNYSDMNHPEFLEGARARVEIDAIYYAAASL
jgi:hypothetical protein